MHPSNCRTGWRHRLLHFLITSVGSTKKKTRKSCEGLADSRLKDYARIAVPRDLARCANVRQSVRVRGARECAGGIATGLTTEFALARAGANATDLQNLENVCSLSG